MDYFYIKDRVDVFDVFKCQVMEIFQDVANRPIPELANLAFKVDAARILDYFFRACLRVAVLREFISLETLRRINGF